MNARSTVGVLAMAYGTPRHRDEILAYYTDIRRGRPPTDEQLADLVQRYEAIGGLSPLRQRTERQRDVLQAALGEGFIVELGMKHSAPSIEDGVAALIAAGASCLVGLVLAPHDSVASVGTYLQRFDDAAAAADVTARSVRSWAVDPAFVDFTSAAIVEAMATLPAGSELVVTAHSLPQRVIDAGDVYVDEVNATAKAVTDGLPNPPRWQVGWQSAGRTGEAWIGPDINEIIIDAAQRGVPGIAVSAVGFVADHLEVLYDLDIAAAHVAEQHGIAFARTRCVNDDPAVLGSLAERIRAIAEECR